MAARPPSTGRWLRPALAGPCLHPQPRRPAPRSGPAVSWGVPSAGPLCASYGSCEVLSAPRGAFSGRVRAGWSAGEAGRACSQRAPSYAPRRPCCPLLFCVFLSHPGGVGASREGTLVPASSAPGASLVTRLFERGPDGRVPSSPTPAPDAHVQAPGPGPTQHEAVVPSRIGLLFVSLDCLCFKEELF